MDWSKRWLQFMIYQTLFIYGSVLGIQERVAVCITGQIARWLPEQQIHGLIDSNPNYFFSFFFVFQIKDSQHPVSYHLEGPQNSSNIAMNRFEDGIGNISDMYTRRNSELANIRFLKPFNDDEWKLYLNLNKSQELDRIREISNNNKIVLNIYRNQHECLVDILHKEHQRNEHEDEHKRHFKYDYFIFTREDIYYFHPMNLSTPIHLLKQRHHDVTASETTHTCHMITKDCLDWGGINMRVEITRKAEGYKIFGSRLHYYRKLYGSGGTVFNPEEFELTQLHAHKYNVCPVSVDVLGTAVARPSPNHPEGVCFFEVDLAYEKPCYPLNLKEKIMTMRCSNYTLI